MCTPCLRGMRRGAWRPRRSRRVIHDPRPLQEKILKGQGDFQQFPEIWRSKSQRLTEFWCQLQRNSYIRKYMCSIRTYICRYMCTVLARDEANGAASTRMIPPCVAASRARGRRGCATTYGVPAKREHTCSRFLTFRKTRQSSVSGDSLNIITTVCARTCETRRQSTRTIPACDAARRARGRRGCETTYGIPACLALVLGSGVECVISRIW